MDSFNYEEGEIEDNNNLTTQKTNTSQKIIDINSNINSSINSGGNSGGVSTNVQSTNSTSPRPLSNIRKSTNTVLGKVPALKSGEHSLEEDYSNNFNGNNIKINELNSNNLNNNNSNNSSSSNLNSLNNNLNNNNLSHSQKSNSSVGSVSTANGRAPLNTTSLPRNTTSNSNPNNNNGNLRGEKLPCNDYIDFS